MRIIIDNQRFIGTGKSKEIAKTRAAEFALEKLFDMCFDKKGKINHYHALDLSVVISSDF